MSTNPFFERSSLEYELPPFSQITHEHYREGFDVGMARHLEEIAAITAQSDVTFENTIVALEKSGGILNRTSLVFFNVNWSDGTPEIQAIDEEYSAKLAAHNDAIMLNPELFKRIRTLFENRSDLGLDAESTRLLEKYYEDFVHAGADLTENKRARLREINESLARLETQFGKLLLADTNDLALTITDESHLEGLDVSQIASARSAAQSRGIEDGWVIPMVNFTGHPLLAHLSRRELRQEIMERSLSRGGRSNENSTSATLLEMAALRIERAKLFGFTTHAEYVLSRQTAKNPENVHRMLRNIAPRALRNAMNEAEMIRKTAESNGFRGELQSWDWSYFAEQVRIAEYAIDTEELKPYFELERVLKDGVFFAAGKLFGLTFHERTDLTTYHPEARAFEVLNEDGSKRALFIADFYARPTKRGGAWMNSLVDQNSLLNQKPVVVNNLNIPKPAPGEPTFLTLDELRTLFHEFGHALHGMLSSVTYPRFSGTSVERDYVEFPSQVNEMWIYWPEVLSNYAYHFETGEPLARDVIERLESANTFEQGYKTLSYLAAAVIDLAWHELDNAPRSIDISDFESKVLRDYGLHFDLVPTRYRSNYFSHIFAGGYSAGYYGYIWSEVLDADTVEWFKENGGLTRANGEHFENSLLGRGGSRDSMEMFRQFRGRDASPEPLLSRRGLL